MIHCEWGACGVTDLAEIVDVLVIVDVLSFSTAVDIATARGAEIIPFENSGDKAKAQANALGATLAGPRGCGSFSLSPASFLDVEAGTRVVLPSINGATLSRMAVGKTVFAGSLRNASAVARAAASCGESIGVIPAGELRPDGSLRPAVEDWLGAGAIVFALGGNQSAESMSAAATFEVTRPRLQSALLDSVSGRELVDSGFERDVILAAELDVSDGAPKLVNGAYALNR